MSTSIESRLRLAGSTVLSMVSHTSWGDLDGFTENLAGNLH